MNLLIRCLNKVVPKITLIRRLSLTERVYECSKLFSYCPYFEKRPLFICVIWGNLRSSAARHFKPIGGWSLSRRMLDVKKLFLYVVNIQKKRLCHEYAIIIHYVVFTCQHKLCSRWEIIKIHSLSHLASTCGVFCNIFRSHVVYMYYIKRFRGLYQRRGGITWMLAFRRRAGSSSSGGGWICDYYYRDMCSHDLFRMILRRNSRLNVESSSCK